MNSEVLSATHSPCRLPTLWILSEIKIAGLETKYDAFLLVQYSDFMIHVGLVLFTFHYKIVLITKNFLCF